MSISTSKRLCKKAVQSFIDVLILAELKKETLGGYDLLSLINQKYRVVISPATVYAALYSLERKGLIKGAANGRARTYELTKKGYMNQQFLARANEELENFITNISMLEATKKESA